MAEISNYKVAAAPHRLDSSNTRKIMLDVLIALLPCLVCGVVFFGLYSLLLVVICAATCFVSEQIYNLIRKKPLTFDLSALVTGLILGLNLPPRAPWYIPVIGGVFAIIVVKMLFGGLGKNFANPAATARVFLLLAYSSLMTQYIGADISGNLLSTDAVTAPTYLGGGTAALVGEFWGVRDYWGYVLQLLFGYVGGCIGETCKVAVLAGAVYLIARRVIDWRIPLVYILTAAVMVLACYGSASEILLQLLSGGMLFGAVFMATDYATSPKWRYNRILYAVGLGVITVLIRRFGTYPEGTSLAILIMNLLVPVMDKYLLPVRFGQMTKAGKPYPQVMKWGMRGVSLALVLALAVAAPLTLAAERRRPVETELPAAYRYVQSMAATSEGEYTFNVKGSAMIGDYEQKLEYEVTISSSERVEAVEPIQQSTMGYTAELNLFLGKTYEEIRSITDLSGTDAETSATYTNTALKSMLEECFVAKDAHSNAVVLPATFRYIKAAADSSLGEGRAYLVAGIADLTEYNYQQSLLYYVFVNDGKITEILPLVQSTMGFTAELSLFVGKSYAEIAALTDLGTDAETSATFTNTALKNMALECLLADDVIGGAAESGASVKARAESSLFGGVSFLAEGVADLQEYNYKQPLLYYVNIDGDKVAQVIPLVQSTMGYEAEISLFAGKTCEEIRGITDLEGADADTSATRTNTALKEMLLECFEALAEVNNG